MAAPVRARAQPDRQHTSHAICGSYRTAAAARSCSLPASSHATPAAQCAGVERVRAQMEQTSRNPGRRRVTAGATWADVVKANTHVTDVDQCQKCADVCMRH